MFPNVPAAPGLPCQGEDRKYTLHSLLFICHVRCYSNVFCLIEREYIQTRGAQVEEVVPGERAHFPGQAVQQGKKCLIV